MEVTTPDFKNKADTALADGDLQDALGLFKYGFLSKRAEAIAAFPGFEKSRDAAKDIKDRVLANLDHYLERYEAKVLEQGGHVHWARDSAEACRIVHDLCREEDARTVTKSKSMIGEEVGVNEALEAAGIEVVETDLGEYIIQLAGEPPSHIIGPAVHKTKDQVSDLFVAHHAKYGKTERLTVPADMVAEAREVLRGRYFEADVGITGANFLIAETGSSVIVTNEGNGDLTQVLPRTHIVLTSLEKIVPTLDDAATLLRVLGRSATGQDMSAYTTISTGPRRPGEEDGPEHYHVILLDNGRTGLLGTPFQEILRCIRCGACMNHCPIYTAIGGHAYGWVYPGPIGAALSPALIGIAAAGHPANASTFCGRCESVCPMRIALPKIMRHWRNKEFEAGLAPVRWRVGLGLWAWLARRPRLYRLAGRLAIVVLAMLGNRKGRFRRLPFAAGWTGGRDLPAPEGGTFQSLWAARR
ncbi:MAG: lactate utilization protein B [Alphaproteobacteria bacterium]|jgi:L-lactate dehydrogenase complex protein LldF|nr:lactate utilization protein B [Alphaproteobacteria bacterium]MDP6517696.1 lactate utilization protein B [Alphaproteobacteria bacterium]